MKTVSGYFVLTGLIYLYRIECACNLYQNIPIQIKPPLESSTTESTLTSTLGSFLFEEISRKISKNLETASNSIALHTFHVFTQRISGLTEIASETIDATSKTITLLAATTLTDSSTYTTSFEMDSTSSPIATDFITSLNGNEKSVLTSPLITSSTTLASTTTLTSTYTQLNNNHSTSEIYYTIITATAMTTISTTTTITSTTTTAMSISTNRTTTTKTATTIITNTSKTSSSTTTTKISTLTTFTKLFTTSSTTTITATRMNPCPSGWQYQFSRCYYINTTLMTFLSAFFNCQKYDATLMTVRNDQEFDYTTTILNQINKTDTKLFLGALALLFPLDFTWNHGTKLPKKSPYWCTNSPDNSGGNRFNLKEGCVAVVSKSKTSSCLDDIPCNSTCMSICEKSP